MPITVAKIYAKATATRHRLNAAGDSVADTLPPTCREASYGFGSILPIIAARHGYGIRLTSAGNAATLLRAKGG